MNKHFLLSKTVWFGIAQIAFGSIGFFTGWMDQQAAGTLVVTGFGTIGFRFNASTPISISGN